MRNSSRERADFWRLGVLYVIGALALSALFVLLFPVVLQFFAAVLLAVLLRWPTNQLVRRGWNDKAALITVVAVVLLLFAAGAWLLGASLVAQFNALTDKIPELVEGARSRLGELSVLRPLLEEPEGDPQQSMRVLSRGVDVLTTTFGAAASLVLILFMGLLLAIDPQLYVRGAVRLLPRGRRARVEEVVAEAGETLQRWSVGQLALMVLVGSLTWLGLWLLEVPMSGALGLLSGVLTFVPFIGPLVAGALAVLVALTDGVTLALWVAAVCVGVQVIEGACEPFVQQRAVHLPPVLLLLAQIALAMLAGPMGIILATPLTAVALVFVKRIYVEDVLGEPSPAEAADAQPAAPQP